MSQSSEPKKKRISLPHKIELRSPGNKLTNTYTSFSFGLIPVHHCWCKMNGALLLIWFLFFFIPSFSFLSISNTLVVNKLPESEKKRYFSLLIQSVLTYFIIIHHSLLLAPLSLLQILTQRMAIRKRQTTERLLPLRGRLIPTHFFSSSHTAHNLNRNQGKGKENRQKKIVG